jgi:hypothetical protein
MGIRKTHTHVHVHGNEQGRQCGATKSSKTPCQAKVQLCSSQMIILVI